MWNIDTIKKAWELATKAHEGQTYGGANKGEKIVYINHIGSVFMEVVSALPYHPEMNGELALLCAILHDTIEDTKITYDTILREFGKEVADGVSALSKNENLPTKKEQMLDSLARIKRQAKEIWMVKLADRISNLSQPPFYWDDFKKEKYRNEAKLIYDELKDGSAVLSERLLFKIEDYRKYIAQ